MKNLEAPEIWYITGSQHLYGEQTLRQVAANSQEIVENLNGTQRLPLKLVQANGHATAGNSRPLSRS
jgi:L-arabinose isomerase